MEEFLTACPRNCYSSCSFRVRVENNQIRRIISFEGNLATPEGPCIKGLSYIERVSSPQRIIHPLQRNSDGSFSRISTENALKIIAGKLLQYKKEFGPHSLLFYKGSGMSGLTNEISGNFWKLFGGATTTYGNLCWPAGLEAVRLTLGDVKHNVPWDLKNARMIVIWGKNPAETNIQEISFIASARRSGTKIVVIDPRRTPTADKADVLYTPRPGTDGALALAIARIIIEKSLHNEDFIRQYVSGFEKFRDALSIDSKDAEAITGIPATDIEQLAVEIATTPPVTFLPGYGLQRYTNGGQTIRAILSLALITGNIGRSGAGFNYANLQSYVFDDLPEPLVYYPDPVADAPFRRTLSMATLGHDMLHSSSPELKMAWVERGNPLTQSPDSNRVREAFSKLEFKVVVEQFMTDTAQMADIVLPAKSMFEQSDVIGSYWSPYIQLKPKVLEPPGEVMTEPEYYYHLASLMGIDNSNWKELPPPGDSNIIRWLAERMKSYPGVTLEMLSKGPLIAPEAEEVAFSGLYFPTPSGKAELVANSFRERWGVNDTPVYTPPDRGAAGDERFTLWFISPNTASRIHSQFGNLSAIRESVPEQLIEISEADAAARGISDGDTIRLFNLRGEVISRCRITNRLSAGCVVLPNGIWLAEGGAGNSLIAGRETDMGHGASFHDTRIEIEKYKPDGQ
jgi:anaerobic selenocysteine-containing dehydrogenase